MQRISIILAAIVFAAPIGCAASGDSAGSDGADPGTMADGGATNRVAVTPELLGTGRSIYRRLCVQCHGFGGRGDGTSARAFETPPRDHTDAAVMNAIADPVIAATIRYGGADRGFPNMPAFAQVSRDEVVALTAYVRSLSRPEVSSIEVGEIQ